MNNITLNLLNIGLKHEQESKQTSSKESADVYKIRQRISIIRILNQLNQFKWNQHPILSLHQSYL